MLGKKTLLLVVLGGLIIATIILKPSCSIRWVDNDNLVVLHQHGSGESTDSGAQIRALTDAVLDDLYRGDTHSLYERISSWWREDIDFETFAAGLSGLPRAPDRTWIATEVYEVEAAVLGIRKDIPETSPVYSDVLKAHLIFGVPIKGRIAHSITVVQEPDTSGPVVLWCLFEHHDGEWRWRNLHRSPRELGGHDTAWFLRKADEFENSGQVRNALQYRRIALELLPHVAGVIETTEGRQILSFIETIESDGVRGAGVADREFWLLSDDSSLRVTKVYPAPIASGIYLEVNYLSSLSDMRSDAAAQERARVLDYMRSEFPEYMQAFDGIYIGSMTPDLVGFRQLFVDLQ